MKIQLDFDRKAIKVENNVNFGEFMKKIKQIFPNGEWKEFDLETNVSINWYPQYTYTEPRWINPNELNWINPNEPFITYSNGIKTGIENISTTTGIVNIETCNSTLNKDINS